MNFIAYFEYQSNFCLKVIIYNMLLAEDELSELSVVLRRWILAEREPIIGIKKGC